MKKAILSVIIAIFFFTIPVSTFAWGKKGHQLVAEIAYHFLDDSTRQKVQQYLGKMSFKDAGTWMDDMRSNDFYSYMRTWHYIDMDKGQDYKPEAVRNLLTVLNAAIIQLEQDHLKNKDIKTDILLIFHLVGDLHQPLHTGYTIDKGGNTIDVSAADFAANLHSVWDTQIIEEEGVTFYDCLKHYDMYTPDQIKAIKKINLLQWMKQSRSYLDTVYNFKNGFLDKNYVDNAKTIIEKQLLIGGMRLASILTEVLKSYKVENTNLHVEDFNKIDTVQQIPLVAIEELAKHEGDLVKVCTTILDGSYKETTVLNAGTDASKDLLSVLILPANRNNFNGAPETYYKGKKVCITGIVALYKGKPTITVKNEKQLVVQ